MFDTQTAIACTIKNLSTAKHWHSVTNLDSWQRKAGFYTMELKRLQAKLEREGERQCS